MYGGIEAYLHAFSASLRTNNIPVSLDTIRCGHLANNNILSLPGTEIKIPRHFVRRPSYYMDGAVHSTYRYLNTIYFFQHFRLPLNDQTRHAGLRVVLFDVKHERVLVMATQCQELSCGNNFRTIGFQRRVTLKITFE